MGRKKQADRKGGRSTDLSPPPGPTQGPAALQPGTSEAPTPPPPKEKKPSGFSMLLLHVHPRMVPEEALAFTRTCGLGGMAVVLLVLLAGTGALLLLAYEPSAERAYGSVLSLRDDTAIGGFVRNIHFWAANSLVLVAVLHLLRVFYTGAFHAPRRFNWVIGLLLLKLVLASNFTGYLLPWDQLAFWAVTIGTGMLEYVPLVGPTLETALRGGPEVGPKTLSIFFVLHIAILPILGAILAAFHFWLVRKAGGVILSEAAGTGSRARAHDGPHLAEPGVPRNGGGPRSGGGRAPHRRGLRCAAPGAGESGHEPEPGQGPVVFHGDPGTSGPSAPGFRRPGGADAGGGLPGVSTLPELRRDPLGPLVPLGQWAAHGPGGRGDGPGGSARRHPHYRVCGEPPEAACRSCPRP